MTEVINYGGALVSTRAQSIDCMRRIVSGPPKSSDKNINAEKQNVVAYDFVADAQAEAAACAAYAA